MRKKHQAHDCCLKTWTIHRHGNLFCLAGIGAHLSGFVASARDAKEMLVLDGCPLACAGKNLEQAGIPVGDHFIMMESGVEKRQRNIVIMVA